LNLYLRAGLQSLSHWLFLRGVVGPKDDDSRIVARLLQAPGSQRDRVTGGLFVPTAESPGLGELERALHLAVAAEPAMAKVKAAVRNSQLPRADRPPLDQAVAQGVLTEAEAEAIRAADAARMAAIEVAAFSLADYAAGR
jgi:acyl-CoA dehydrogenase